MTPCHIIVYPVLRSHLPSLFVLLLFLSRSCTLREQNAKQAEIRAAGASILRTLVTTTTTTTSAGGRSSSSSSAHALKISLASTADRYRASPGCRYLLERLRACGVRSKAICLLAALEVFGDHHHQQGSQHTEEEVWQRESREDGFIVLVAAVKCVTKEQVPSSSSSSPRHRGSWQASAAETSGGGGGLRRGLGEFTAEESEALSFVCSDALRALVRGSWFCFVFCAIFYCWAKRPLRLIVDVAA